MQMEFREESKFLQEQNAAIGVTSLQSPVEGVPLLYDDENQKTIADYIMEKTGITSWVENV